MVLQGNKYNYHDTSSLAKPPKFNKDNFPFWKARMMLFLAGFDPQIPYFMENGPYTPTTLIHVVPTTANTSAILEKTIVKDITQWTDDDRTLVNIDTNPDLLFPCLYQMMCFILYVI